MSYEEVEKLIERQTGEKLLSDQKIWHIVVDKAVEVSLELQADVGTVLAGCAMPAVQSHVDIYTPEQQEILLFDDAIQVKGQKQTREKQGDKEENTQQGATPRSRVNTEVMMLEKATGGFAYMSAAIDRDGQELVPWAEIVPARIMQEYGESQAALPIVAITDGAKAIRARLTAIFGITITLILDWYHLGKKIKELMSMIAKNKQEKERYLAFIFDHLWRGNTQEVLRYLRTEVNAKHPGKLSELIGYLEKHQGEIIDDERRQKAGKTIGSGRMEKGVDQVIGFRQKKKGMSWRQKGSRALGILKIVELKNQWTKLWFPERIAA